MRNTTKQGKVPKNQVLLGQQFIYHFYIVLVIWGSMIVATRAEISNTNYRKCSFYQGNKHWRLPETCPSLQVNVSALRCTLGISRALLLFHPKKLHWFKGWDQCPILLPFEFWNEYARFSDNVTSRVFTCKRTRHRPLKMELMPL